MHRGLKQFTCSPVQETEALSFEFLVNPVTGLFSPNTLHSSKSSGLSKYYSSFQQVNLKSHAGEVKVLQNMKSQNGQN